MGEVNAERADALRLAGTASRSFNGGAARLRARLRIAVALLVAAVALVPGAASAAAGTLTSGDYNGPDGAIHYELYVPSSYTPDTPVPLVVALHGCTQTADQFRQQTRWDAQAEGKGFIVVFPQQDSSANTFRCWNFFQDRSMHRGGGDAARIAALTSVIENTYNVDPTRVYAAGFSAGGAMTSVMAATYPDYFAAVGIGSGCEYAATATCAGYQSADPTQAGQAAYREMGPRARPMPFIAFQGDADPTVPPKNADQLVQQWLLTDDMADDGAANGSVSTRPGKTSMGFTPGGGLYTVASYAEGQNAELAQYWLIRGMKHAWSGGDASQQYTDPSGPDETAAMYAFFVNHPAPSLTRPAPPAPPQQPQPAASTARHTAATVSKPKLSRDRIVFRMSSPGSVTLRLQRRVVGHVKNGRCVAGKRARRTCTRYSTRARIVRTVAKAGRVAIKLPRKVRGHRLPRGHYRAVVTPADSAGQIGSSRTVTFVMR
ncbi:MAG TPA: PHB depolymerase family esterase [Thermoleophilaceae bacterium]|jgi:poly(hydroxyalkanoate) depolymerase family esterase|nr:PHB depolymerase family esterase [Thermoleophilaceae bacterium]